MIHELFTSDFFYTRQSPIIEAVFFASLLMELRRFFHGSLTPPGADERAKRYGGLSETYLIMTMIECVVVVFYWAEFTQRLFVQDHAAITMNAGVTLIYGYEFFVYVQELYLMVRGRGSAEKDYVRMFLHHCITLALMAGAVLSGYCRIGVVVMLLHDTVDVFLYQAQAWQLHHRAHGGHRRRVLAWWVAFVVTFTACRMVAFPMFISRLMHLPQFIYLDGRYARIGECVWIPLWRPELPTPMDVAPYRYDTAAGCYMMARGTDPLWTTANPLLYLPVAALTLAQLLRMAPHDAEYPASYQTAERVLPLMLFALFLMQVTWFVDIIRMIYRMTTSSKGVETPDIREGNKNKKRKKKKQKIKPEKKIIIYIGLII